MYCFKQDDDIHSNVLDEETAKESDMADVGIRAREGTQAVQRTEIDFNKFLHTIMPAISSSQKLSEARQLSASAVFREIQSYIKGSHLALAKEGGRLSREEYLKLPAKMAPNFKGLCKTETLEDMPAERKGTRDLLYDLYLSLIHI